MNDQENSREPKKPGRSIRQLRIWPAVLLLVCMWGLWIVPGLFEEVPMMVVMVRFMGPLACSALVVLWWLSLSRASLVEKALGLIGIVIIAAITNMLADKTIQGFIFFMFAAPWGITGFAIALIGLARTPSSRRTWVALLVALVGFGYWTLIRVDEYRGDFDNARSWRWEPSPEDLFMKELAVRSPTEIAVDANAADAFADPVWPEFRGAKRDAVLSGVVLEEDWQTHLPKEIWRMRVGPGWSSFSVAGNRLFTQEQRGEQEVVVCYDADSGAQIWVHEYESRFFEAIGGVGPRGTPTLSDSKLLALGATGLLHCLDPITGQQIWRRDIGEDAGRKPPTWGFASSPLVTAGVVIVHAGGDGDKGLLAYDLETGDRRWGAATGDHTYSSPHLAEICGKICVLMLTNDGLTIVDPSDGAPLGEHVWKYSGYRVVQPLVVENDSLVLGTATGAGTRRIKLSLKDDKFSTEETWTTQRMNPYFNDFVAHRGFLYGFDNNIFACVDLASGQRKWKKGRYGNGQVVLLPAGDQLLVISEDGELVLLRATPDEHEELARCPALDGRTWNHPVLVGNRVYVRNGAEAACYELKTNSPTGTQAEAD